MAFTLILEKAQSFGNDWWLQMMYPDFSGSQHEPACAAQANICCN